MQMASLTARCVINQVASWHWGELHDPLCNMLLHRLGERSFIQPKASDLHLPAVV